MKGNNLMAWTALAGGMGLTGCVSLETAAPPAPVPGGGDRLAGGRELYVGKCAKCHAAEPVRQYSAADWGVIMPDMAKRGKFTAEETAAVTAYVTAVLRGGGVKSQ